MENTIVGERSQAKKATHLFEMSRIGKSGKFLDIQGSLVLAEGW